MKIYKLLTLTLILLIHSVALSDDLSLGVFVGGENSVTPAPAQGFSTISGGKLIFRLHTSCYPTNLRSVANPISPDSTIKAYFKFKISNQDLNFYVSFPGSTTTGGGLTAATINPVNKVGDIVYNFTLPSGVVSTATLSYTNYDLPGNSLVGISGNKVISYVDLTTTLGRNPDGTAATIVEPPQLISAGFHQTMPNCVNRGAIYGSYGYSSHIPTYACGSYMAKTGSATAVVSNFRVSKDNSTIDLDVAFPGQTGFCGGWWSPLMLFFDDKRPQFSSTSDFPLNPGGRTSWVEKNAPGYFLVFDKNNNRKIKDKNQLFGDGDGFANGFEQLKKHDSNKDGFISAKDKTFKKLYLWNDKNADGVSDRGELVALSKRVQKISLNYIKDEVESIGRFAEAREHSQFYFYGENNKIKKGKIIDIWLAPQTETQLAATGP